MKNCLLIASLVALLALTTLSCTKENKQDQLNNNLAQTETQLLKSYQDAKSNDALLKVQVGANGQYTDSRVMMEDKLYHMNDSLFTLHYLTYCKDMMDGDNMMGGNMMGSGNTMHGSGMMATHTFIGDTAKVNQCNRDLNTIRIGHTAHHPVN
jgi:hypothetical protein